MLELVSFKEGLLVGGLALWFLITVVRQFSNDQRIWGRDVCCLIPRWTFFAGAPIRVDYSLLLRDHLRDGSLGPWREIPFRRRHTWWRLLFDPDSRCRRVIYILTMRAVIALQSGAADALQGSPHYRALLQAALSFPGSPDADAREAVILRSFGFLAPRPPQAIIKSGLQSLSTSVGRP